MSRTLFYLILSSDFIEYSMLYNYDALHTYTGVEPTCL